MNNILKYILVFLTILCFEPIIGQNTYTWIQPSQKHPSTPLWGHTNGIRVGISPTPGPRGLLRIFTPYLGHKEDKVFNFIAFEPIPEGETIRGYSELEMSKLDDVRGKRFWSSNDSIYTEPKSPTLPATGITEFINGVETLTVYIFSEQFENGAKVYTRLRFYEDRPHEFELTTNISQGSVPLKSYILTATMGNYARLRNLYLADTVKSSLELWPDYNDIHFTDHDITPYNQMIKDNRGRVYFIAEPDENNPMETEYAEGTRKNWVYYGDKATQYWYNPSPQRDLLGLVNGRFTYWGGKAPIPGGISYENFEFKSPFKNGETFVFGVVNEPADRFIKKIEKKNNY